MLEYMEKYIDLLILLLMVSELEFLKDHFVDDEDNGHYGEDIGDKLIVKYMYRYET